MKKSSDFDLQKVGLIKIFSNLDTQSAIVAAIAISVITFLANGFIDLCNYIYWNAYFTKFNIPLSYINQAIIYENGMKYTAVLCIPLFFFVWYLLQMLQKSLLFFLKKRKGTCTTTQKKRIADQVVKAILAILFTACFIGVFLPVFAWSMENRYYLFLAFYAEFVIFVFWTGCKATFGKRFSLSKKAYYAVRIVGTFLLIYLILGIVYFMGSYRNYRGSGIEGLQIVNDAEINYFQLTEQDEIDSQLVLFETEDTYYVTDVKIIGGSSLKVQIWGSDTYRFIDKIGCSVKTIPAYLAYVGSNRGTLFNGMDFEYFLLTAAFVLIFVPLISIPKKEEKSE